MANSNFPEPVRIGLVDPHEILRMGLVSFLKSQLHCEICFEASDGRAAVSLIERTPVDIAIIGIELPGLNGLELTRQFRRLVPQTEVIILTALREDELTRQAFVAGAKAFLLKADTPIHLIEAVKCVMEHRVYFTPQSHSVLIHASQHDAEEVPPPERLLTSREREVLQLIGEGLSSKEIASALGISTKTAETHRSTLMRKLGVTRTSDLVIYAIKNKIVQA